MREYHQKTERPSPRGLIKALAFAFLLFFGVPTMAADQDSKTASKTTQGFDHTYGSWTEILTSFVVMKGPASQVKYQELKKTDKILTTFLASLSAVSKSEFDSWSEKQRLAFLINAYNAFTIRHILNNYPVTSIRKIGGFFTNPWKVKFFKLFGKERHLDWIEHETIRKQFAEPRIHFALNCASVGCPSLRQEAYIAEKLEEQLEEQTKIFLRDTTRNRIGPDKKKIFVSKIFDTTPWFAQDFVKKSGSVGAFVAPYMTDDPQLRKQIKSGALEVEFLKYDWSLNEAK